MTTVVTERGFHLGKLDPVESPFGDFKSYFAEGLGTPPTSAAWGRRVTSDWKMFGNGPDPEVTIAPPGWAGAGDCVEACKGHGLLLSNYDEDGHTVGVPSANDVIEQYCAYQRCTPAGLFDDPSKYDQGEDVSTSLTGWCTTDQYGVKLALTAPIDSSNQDDVKNGIAIGGCVIAGIQLPESAEREFPGEWTWNPSSPNLGGHCVLLTGYSDELVEIITWGQLILASWDFLKHTLDEAHVAVFPQAIAAGKGPTGLLIPKWESDLKNLAA